jgi:hypothetical protein
VKRPTRGRFAPITQVVPLAFLVPFFRFHLRLFRIKVQNVWGGVVLLIDGGTGGYYYYYELQANVTFSLVRLFVRLFCLSFGRSLV